MASSSVDLPSLFQAAASNLAASQQAINQADAYNGDHGSNMVNTFQTIAEALEKKKGSSTSAALKYAARQVGSKSASGSGQLYAQNLSRAASQFKGRQVDQRGALDLLATLIGAGQPAASQPAKPRPSSPSASASGDEMLGALLGGAASQPSQGQAASGSDMLGALLGGMGSGQASQGGDMLGTLLSGLGGAQAGSGSSQAGGLAGLDMGDLLNAGLAFMQAKQSGGSTVQALVQAVAAGSGMGSSVHRQQSTETVVNSFLQALASGG